jgi:hypothetical protein
LLQAGVIVQEGWTDSVPARFAEDRCAAVAPLLLRAEDPQQIAAAGISYTAGGRRVLNDAGSPLREVRGLLPGEILGPALTAAFYRRRVIRSLGGFCEGAGEFYADVDLAMSLQSLGLRSFLEPRSIAWAPDASFPERRLSFTGGCQAERVFWRHDSLGGKPRSLLAHGAVVLGEWLAHCARPAAFAHLLGRTVALADFSARRRQQARLRQAAESRDRRTRASADVQDADDAEGGPRATISLEEYRNRHAA